MAVLFLFHGRRSPDEHLQGWGDDGPTIRGIKSLEPTPEAAEDEGFTLTFCDGVSFELARAITGWEEVEPRGSLKLVMAMTEDLVRVRGLDGTVMYYGDWNLGETTGASTVQTTVHEMTTRVFPRAAIEKAKLHLRIMGPSERVEAIRAIGRALRDSIPKVGMAASLSAGLAADLSLIHI